MPLPLSSTAARWRALLAGRRPAAGMWIASGSPVVAEICAGSGLDWLLIDSEHAGSSSARPTSPRRSATSASRRTPR